MPKALSLKKNQPSKSQKSITHFFKDIKDGGNSQKEQDNKPAIKPQPSVKRKATSPIYKLNEEDKDAKSPSQGQLEHQKRVKIHSPRKENGIKKNETKNHEIKKNEPKNHEVALISTEHENLDHTESQKSSPKNIIKSIHSPKKENGVGKNECKNHEATFKIKEITPSPTKQMPNSRSPLSLVNKNHDDIFLNGNRNHEIISPMKTQSLAKNLVISPFKGNKTPIKCSPGKPEVHRSPRLAKLNSVQNASSPCKASSVRTLEFEDQLDSSIFVDDWGDEDIEEMVMEDDLDLSKMQRCEIVQVKTTGYSIELYLKNSVGNKGTCIVEGIWCNTPLAVGDTVSVIASRDKLGRYLVSNTTGLLVLRPDHLMSTTSVVAGVFCKRKAVLQERFKGIDGANTAMTIGILIHELVQKALTERLSDVHQLRKVTETLLKESTDLLYSAAITAEEASVAMETYLGPLEEFMKIYVSGGAFDSRAPQKDRWPGRIDEVIDIEENVCCPQLGLKGKIDATVQVTIHDRKVRETMIVPLELKSGQASGSAEHRGQLLLYCMMMNVQRGVSPVSEHKQRALLLYLRDRVDLREVSCGYPERRDLIVLRNELVQHLTPAPDDIDPEKIPDIEDVSQLLVQKLPAPISHKNACSKCAYLTLCQLHLWHTHGPTVSEHHPLGQLRAQAIGHLSEEHIKYFLHWSALLRIEERVQMTSSPLHALWTEDSSKRVNRGACISNLKLKSVVQSGDRYLHVFLRDQDVSVGTNTLKSAKGPQEGEFSIVSIENRPWIAAGVIQAAKGQEIHILLERDVSRRLDQSTIYSIDSYESYATTVQNLTNLGALMEDSDAAERLRRLIIEKQPPEFDKKLPREVGRLGTKLMKTLNIEQQRAVLKAVAAKDYGLLQGLPGTGKTQTISVLIQMLVALKQRVLVTAHTHSAVDTVLTRLPKTLKILRLGSSARVASALQSNCERHLVAACGTTEELAQLYESMEVVGVTCLGSNHAMLARTTFDVCIVDEATQVLQCTVLRALLAANKFILVGDPEQLPPVVRSNAARRLGMEESLFHRLTDPQSTSTLQLQYRMNAPLVELANTVAYGGRLKCASDAVRNARICVDFEKVESLYKTNSTWLQRICSPEPEDAAIFVNVIYKMADTKQRGNTNEAEACLVLAIVDALTKNGVPHTDIGIITPYRDQVALLRRSISKLQQSPLDVSTVDQFQGRDKSVILFSSTRCYEKEKDVKEGEILNDKRRLAVSVTRAKHKFIILGHEPTLQRYAALKTTIDACARVNADNAVMDEVVDKFKCYVQS